MRGITTVERWRHRLPHWEVADKHHFITIRCHGSLPPEACERIAAIRDSLLATEAHSEAFQRLQRQYFLTAEKYLDRGTGFAPFFDADTCRACLGAVSKMKDEGWKVTEAVVMPNHLHLLAKKEGVGPPLRPALIRFKGRSARAVNAALGRRGRFWQEDWFDRWMRDEDELERVVAYIRNNPVKTGLVDRWEDYPWRVSGGKIPEAAL